MSMRWINGTKVRQVKSNLPELQHLVGRESTVVDSFEDEKGNNHYQTEDGFWSPESLLERIDA